MKKLITLRLDEAMLALIETKAKAEGLNRTELIEKAVSVYTAGTIVYTPKPVADFVYTDAVAPSKSSGKGKVELPKLLPRRT